MGITAGGEQSLDLSEVLAEGNTANSKIKNLTNRPTHKTEKADEG